MQDEEKSAFKKQRKTSRDPERIRKQGDVIFKAIKGLEVKIGKMQQSLGPESATALELQRQVRTRCAPMHCGRISVAFVY